MTTKKFAQYMEKQCKGINNFSLEAIFEEYIVLVSGKRIGVLYQEKFYVLFKMQQSNKISILETVAFVRRMRTYNPQVYTKQT